MSSLYFPEGHGRAKGAVTTTKRLPEKIWDLKLRNTPGRDCYLSPAEVLLGGHLRALKDAMPNLDKSKMFPLIIRGLKYAY